MYIWEKLLLIFENSLYFLKSVIPLFYKYVYYSRWKLTIFKKKLSKNDILSKKQLSIFQKLKSEKNAKSVPKMFCF
jgi:hypothetical protein